MTNFKPNDNFFYYLYYIQERMNIFYNKKNGLSKLTSDPIFQKNKFTNVYRILDRASQFLIREVIYNGKQYSKEEMFWRILIYKHFNYPNTWMLLIDKFGDINENVGLSDIAEFLNDKTKEGQVLYSDAYKMIPSFLIGYSGEYIPLKKNKWNKYQYYFHVYNKEINDKGKLDLILSSTSFEDLFNNLKGIPAVGDFLAYQYAQDLIYSELFDFDLNTFCAVGLVAIRGIERTFDIEGKPNYGEIVKWAQKNYEQLAEDYSKKFQFNLEAHLIDGLLMKVPDFSNCFCGTSKYLRVKYTSEKDGDKQVENRYNPHPSPIEYMFPPKWGKINL